MGVFDKMTPNELKKKILAFDSENNNYKNIETLKSTGDFIQFNL